MRLTAEDWGEYNHLKPYEPWAEVGEAPIAWLRREGPKLLVPTEAIISGGAPYRFEDAPDEPGIYFLLSGDRIVYVGISDQVSNRIISHHRNKKGKFDRVYYIRRIPPLFLAHFEAFYIARHQPECNISMPHVPDELRAHL